MSNITLYANKKGGTLKGAFPVSWLGMGLDDSGIFPHFFLYLNPLFLKDGFRLNTIPVSPRPRAATPSAARSTRPCLVVPTTVGRKVTGTT